MRFSSSAEMRRIVNRPAECPTTRNAIDNISPVLKAANARKDLSAILGPICVFRVINVHGHSHSQGVMVLTRSFRNAQRHAEIIATHTPASSALSNVQWVVDALKIINAFVGGVFQKRIADIITNTLANNDHLIIFPDLVIVVDKQKYQWQ